MTVAVASGTSRCGKELLRGNERSSFRTCIGGTERASEFSKRQSFSGWRLSAGTDYDHGRENRDRKKQEDATFSGHNDERFTFLFSEDEKRWAYYQRSSEFFCGSIKKRDRLRLRVRSG